MTGQSNTAAQNYNGGGGGGGRRRNTMMTQSLHRQHGTQQGRQRQQSASNNGTRNLMIFILIVSYQFMTMFRITQRFHDKIDWSTSSLSSLTTATAGQYRNLDRMTDDDSGDTIAGVDVIPGAESSTSSSSSLPSIQSPVRGSSWRTMLQKMQSDGVVKTTKNPPPTDKTATTTTTSSSSSRKTTKNHHPVRVIYGIVSHDLDVNEIRRRYLIRRSFLKYFHDYPVSKVMKDLNITTTPNDGKDYENQDDEEEDKKHWICSLNDLDQGRLEYPDKCRFAYAFIIGGRGNTNDENIPTMLLDFNESYPISLPPPPNSTKSDRQDCVYLNIKENGKFGKSPTWFRYVVDVLDRHPEWKDEHGNSFEYIWKSDTDNLLYTPEFFRYIDKKLPRKKKMDDKVVVYGGRPLDYEGCGGDTHDHCSQLVGPIFMAGGGYFLSIDLARFVTNSSAFDHYAVKLPHEDMTTGNFVYSYPNATTKIKLVTEQRHKGVIRKHPVKGNKKWKKWWKLMLKQERNKLLKKYYHENVEAARAIVVLSLGDEVAKSNLVERFVWSARNRANYQGGWIVVLSDAPTGRYTEKMGNLPKVLEIPVKPEHYNDNNVTAATSPHRRDMMVQRLKTHILEYIEDEERLDEVQSIYVMETDMVFGSDIGPLFTQWEEQYSISRSSTVDGNDSDDNGDESKDEVGDDDKTTTQSSQERLEQVMKDSSSSSPISKLWFFGGNQKTNTPAGQFVIDRDLSQHCLERWRYMIDRYGSMSSSETEDDSNSNNLFEFLNNTVGTTTSDSTSTSCEVIVIPEDETKIYTPSDEDIIVRVQRMNGTDSVEVDDDLSTSDATSTETTTKNKKKKNRRRQNHNQFPPLVHVRSVASATSTALTVDATIHERFLMGLLNLNPKRKRSKKMLHAKPTIIHLK